MNKPVCDKGCEQDPMCNGMHIQGCAVYNWIKVKK